MKKLLKKNKKKEQIESKPFVNPINRPLSERIEELVTSCPFPLQEFFEENKELVEKYLKKNTYSIKIEEDINSVPAHWWYKNSEGILKAGIKNRPYDTYQKLEWIKCGLDIVYYTKKYIKITTLDHGIQPFNLYDYQEDLLETFYGNRFVIDMQARQSGKSAVVSAFIIHFATFNAAKTVAVAAQYSSQAQEIIERIQLAFERLPLFLQPGIRVYNKQKIVFGNMSKMFSGASKSSAIRGKSVSLLYIDECAFIDNDIKFWEATYPVTSSGTESRIIITSTPNGMKGLFYKIWMESVDKRNEFVNRLVTWDMVPGRDAKWKELEIKNTSAEQFDQEHCCRFRGSQKSLISGAILETLVIKKPIDVRNDGDLKVYYEPKPGHEYILTVDTSRGIGLDYHAFTVIDITEEVHEVAATYRNNTLSTLLYPTLIQHVGNKYNEAHVLVETNDIGEQIANILFYDLEYENLVTVVKKINRQMIGFGNQAQKGVKTSTAVKSIGCANAKTFIEKGRIRLNDEGIINEFGTFVPKGKSYEADVGATDDQAMTIVLYGWAMTQSYFVDVSNQDARRKLVAMVQQNQEEQLLPFGIVDSEFGEFTGDPTLEMSFFSDL